ncbi:MAG: GNAT family N-acetyltransferase [Lachnospiraceae bacterium]|nr:GNAT family N-acetyltransferase [Lachnospiraceae bacterium]
MLVTNFSDQYHIRRLTEEDVEIIYALCKQNRLYYEYCPPFVTRDSIRRDMQALPPKKSMEDKHYIGWFDGDRLIAVMDLIDGYPDARTAFVGFFMTDVSVQRKGVGTAIIRELCAYLCTQQYKAVRLGWVKGNPQSEAFWHKNQFVETGVTYDTDGYTVIVAQRTL